MQTLYEISENGSRCTSARCHQSNSTFQPQFISPAEVQQSGHLIAEHFVEKTDKSTFCPDSAAVIPVAYYGTIALNLHKISGNGRRFKHEVETDGTEMFIHVYTAFIGTRIGYFDYKGTCFYQSGICVVYKNGVLATIYPFGCGVSTTGKIQPYPF